jgi:hypothetical protein
MPVAYILDFAGGTTAQYDAVVAEMDLGGKAADGSLFHGAGATSTGLRVIDVWDDGAAFAAFTAAKTGPITQSKGLAPPAVEQLEVAEVRAGGSPDEEAHFAQVVRLDGLDAASWAALDPLVLPDGVPPAGCVFHVNGPGPNGWIVVDYWTSRAARDTFIAERVQPAMQAAGAAGPPAFEELDLHATLRP